MRKCDGDWQAKQSRGRLRGRIGESKRVMRCISPLMRSYEARNFLRAWSFDTAWGASSFNPLNTGTVNAFARTPSDETRADAEQLSHIILEMQRCFLLHLSKQLAPGNVSFPQ